MPRGRSGIAATSLFSSSMKAVQMPHHQDATERRRQCGEVCCLRRVGRDRLFDEDGREWETPSNQGRVRGRRRDNVDRVDITQEVVRENRPGGDAEVTLNLFARVFAGHNDARQFDFTRTRQAAPLCQLLPTEPAGANHENAERWLIHGSLSCRS